MVSEQWTRVQILTSLKVFGITCNQLLGLNLERGNKASYQQNGAQLKPGLEDQLNIFVQLKTNKSISAYSNDELSDNFKEKL